RAGARRRDLLAARDACDACATVPNQVVDRCAAATDVVDDDRRKVEIFGETVERDCGYARSADLAPPLFELTAEHHDQPVDLPVEEGAYVAEFTLGVIRAVAEEHDESGGERSVFDRGG